MGLKTYKVIIVRGIDRDVIEEPYPPSQDLKRLAEALRDLDNMTDERGQTVKFEIEVE